MTWLNATPINQDRNLKEPQSFALTSTSLKDLPFLYEIRGGFIKGSQQGLFFFMTSQLSFKIYLRLGTARCAIFCTKWQNLFARFFFSKLLLHFGSFTCNVAAKQVHQALHRASWSVFEKRFELPLRVKFHEKQNRFLRTSATVATIAVVIKIRFSPCKTTS